MKSSKLTSKYQATIPKEIRSILKVKAGDVIIFQTLPDKSVVIKKATPLDISYLKGIESTLSEWHSKSDDDAYGNL